MIICMNKALRMRLPIAVPALCAVVACAPHDSQDRAAVSNEPAPAVGSHLFTKLPTSYTGIAFENRVEPTGDLNVFTYRNFYNGGGDATGDLNRDDLPEVMLTSNLHGNHLHL